MESNEDVHVYPDGREVCQPTDKGTVEYRRRALVAWRAQGGRCALCGRPLRLQQSTVDHIQPRGMGGARRDDRQENLQVTCWPCNYEKGSKRASEALK